MARWPGSGTGALVQRATELVRDTRSKVSRHTLRAGSLGMADQSVLSAANFVFMIVAARTLGPAAFGLFSLLFMVIGFIEALQTSLVTSPHNVFGATKSGGDYKRYTGSVTVIQTGLTIIIAILICIAGLVTLQFDRAMGTMLFALAFASAGFQSQEFARRVLYTESRVGATLANDVLTHGLRIGLLGVLIFAGGVTGNSLFLVLGVSCFAGAVYGFWQIRDSIKVNFAREALAEHWRFGRWLCAGRLFAHLPRYLAAAVLSAVLSLGAFGAYRAAYQLVHATNVPLNALENLLRPRFARDAVKGPSAVWGTMLPILIVGVVGFTGFGLFLIVLSGPLLDFFYGAEFAGYAAVMFLLAFRPLAALPERLYSSALQAVHLTRPFFTAKVFGSIIGSIAGTVLVLLFGLPAAGGIASLTTLASVWWLARRWKQHMESESQWESEPQPLPETPIARRTG